MPNPLSAEITCIIVERLVGGNLNRPLEDGEPFSSSRKQEYFKIWKAGGSHRGRTPLALASGLGVVIIVMAAMIMAPMAMRHAHGARDCRTLDGACNSAGSRAHRTRDRPARHRRSHAGAAHTLAGRREQAPRHNTPPTKIMFSLDDDIAKLLDLE